MKMRRWRSAATVTTAAILMTLTSFTHGGDLLPEGWIGGNIGEYDIGVDRNTAKEGKSSGYIKSRTQTPKSFGTIVQTFSAEDYVAKRVRLSALVKAEKIEGWAGLWMRVDGQGQEEYALSFDNMQTRPIQGTADWKRYEIVLDIPEKSKTVTFGLLLEGSGQAWIDDVQFAVVTSDVPVTGQVRAALPKKPVGLGFEE